MSVVKDSKREEASYTSFGGDGRGRMIGEGDMYDKGGDVVT